LFLINILASCFIIPVGWCMITLGMRTIFEFWGMPM